MVPSAGRPWSRDNSPPFHAKTRYVIVDLAWYLRHAALSRRLVITQSIPSGAVKGENCGSTHKSSGPRRLEDSKLSISPSSTARVHILRVLHDRTVLTNTTLRFTNTSSRLRKHGSDRVYWICYHRCVHACSPSRPRLPPCLHLRSRICPLLFFGPLPHSSPIVTSLL
jgi:hypothetical protein